MKRAHARTADRQASSPVSLSPSPPRRDRRRPRWARRRCLRRRPMHRSTGTSFEHLLAVRRIEELHTTAARRPTFRLVRHGVTLPDARSTRPLRLGGKLIDDVADLGVIAAAVHEGATLLMQSLQRTVIDIATFCRSLERATGPIRCRPTRI